jgi:MFS family permease
MVQEPISGLFLEAMNQIGKEIISLLPKIILALIILAIAIIIIRLLNGFFGKILKIVKLDEMVSKIVQFPFSLSSLIIILIDVGIFLIALFMIAELFLDPKQTQLMTEIFGYAGRIFSIVGVTIFAFIMFNILINRMVIETRMRGYIVLILLILLTVMIIDLTSLSPSIKDSLAQGMSTGLGIAIGVFAIWFFFHEYLDRLLNNKIGSEKKDVLNSKK